jgi:deazaflavin-dependent oxidoreductase (nitroreductase family)
MIMPEKIKSIKKPQGLSRIAFRIPIWLYKARLGWLLGSRFVLLTHKGRRNGVLRQNVLEVVRYIPTQGTCIVASGWDTRSDWFNNIVINPKIYFQIGRKRTSATAIRLTPESAAEELLEHSFQHPLAFRGLEKFMGYRLDGTEEDIQALGRMIPMFMFRPLSENE